ncbi:MAG: CoA-binding protein [Desulfatiglans sp.]|jgi:acetyltransferase|nr:CoA-binding protein [Desulfatiglans sp.]
MTKKLYKLLFHPESIAVIGASNEKLKTGGRVTDNIKSNGYTGKLWAINPKAPDVMGLPTFKSVADLPSAPDLAYIAIPAPFVRASLEELAAKGSKAVIILTAGFGEKDQKGKDEEKVFLEIAEKNNMTLIGPNCSGFLTTCYSGKFAGLIPRLKKGQIDIISGSGATVDYLMEQATMRGLSFSNVVNMGNSIQIGVEDIFELVDENYGPENSRLILMYMESVKKPQKLLKHARSLTKKGCTIVGIKSGVTAAGERAAASHTGAMASPDTAVQALFDKAGIIRVQSKAELIEIACTFNALKGLITDYRVCIVTDAGGPGVMLSDELGRQGLKQPVLTKETQRRLSEVLPPEAAIGNPIDTLPSRTPEQMEKIFTILNETEKDNIDVIFAITGNSGMTDNWKLYEAIMKGMDGGSIPVIPIISSASTCRDMIDKLRDAGRIIFPDEVPVGTALGRLSRKPVLAEPMELPADFDKVKIENILKEQGEQLDPDTVKGIMAASGLKLPFQADVFDKADLKAACERAGYPLVIKVIGPLHKSDVGGVKIGIADYEKAVIAFDELLKIKDAKGVLVQQMIEGTEVILGAKKEERFGHLIMFGLGGIYTEALKDVSFALAPLGLEGGMAMINKIKTLPILKGIRGQKGISLDVLADYLARLSLLVHHFPQIEEIDLNPVKGYGKDLYVVDARIIKGK